MKVCGQTLILIDNDATVTEINQKIVKSTLKYMLYHMPENRAFCLTNYTHSAEEDEVYSSDINDLLCKVDLMEFEAKDSNLVDCLGSVITGWKESDFACRDIVVLTDGLEGASTEFEKEELYYLLENTGYPVYVVYLNQEDNVSAKKQLSAIATLSEGELFETVYPGDDAGVDRAIAEGIFSRMESYAEMHWKAYEESEADGYEQVETVTETDAGKEIETATKPVNEAADENVGAREPNQPNGSVDNTDISGAFGGSDEVGGSLLTDGMEGFGGYAENTEIIYEDSVTSNAFSYPTLFLTGCILLICVIVAAIVSGLIVIKRRKQKSQEMSLIQAKSADNTRKDDFFEDISFNEGFNDAFDDALFGGDDYATRLLSDTDTVLLNEDYLQKIELADTEDDGKIMSLSIKDGVILGRKLSESDYVISDDSVSKRHCEITYEDGDFYVRDLDSSNGTYVNGERITRIRIDSGDILKLGRKSYIVRCI